MNSVLLQHILDGKKDQNPVEFITTIGQAVAAVKEGFGLESGGGGGGGGDNLYSLGKAVLTSFNTLVAQRSAPAAAPGGLPGPRRTVTGHPAGEITGKPVTGAPNITEINPQPESQESEIMPQTSEKELMALALSQITQGFMLETRMEPADMVELLDDYLPLPKEVRGGMVAKKKRIFNHCRAQLATYFADVDGSEADFEPWFDAVFDSFSDPQREQTSLI
jgi:hypothetical protein